MDQQRNQVIKYEILLSLLSASIDVYLHAAKEYPSIQSRSIINLSSSNFPYPVLSKKKQSKLGKHLSQFLKEYLKKKTPCILLIIKYLLRILIISIKFGSFRLHLLKVRRIRGYT